MSAPEKVEITLPWGLTWRGLVYSLRALSTAAASDLADQIEAQLPIPEPTELGTVIQDGRGKIWLSSYRDASESLVWTREDSYRLHWSGIPGPVTVLHEGWKPGDES